MAGKLRFADTRNERTGRFSRHRKSLQVLGVTLVMCGLRPKTAQFEYLAGPLSGSRRFGKGHGTVLGGTHFHRRSTSEKPARDRPSYSRACQTPQRITGFSFVRNPGRKRRYHFGSSTKATRSRGRPSRTNRSPGRKHKERKRTRLRQSAYSRFAPPVPALMNSQVGHAIACRFAPPVRARMT